MARWPASAKWAAGPALDGQRDMPLALRLSEGLGRSATLSRTASVGDTTGLMDLMLRRVSNVLANIVNGTASCIFQSSQCSHRGSR